MTTDDSDIPQALLTTDQVAARLNVSRRTIQRHVRVGNLAAIKIGTAVRFRPSTVDAWARSMEKVEMVLVRGRPRPGDRSRRR